MVKFNLKTDIPESKFAEVTIGNNGVRITQQLDPITVSGNIGRKREPISIYLSAEAITEIWKKFIANSYSDEIETVYFEAPVENDLGSDNIMDAVY